ncbi:hypothetical protein [Brachyspira hyodysenteriae]|uniref:hypothetical protein n=1 Tax=Brachyspira hyodysenteriae TaxID=159 RepID=UPI001ADD87A0|nr:hypothetical protein [Brachyspira hyodysenteriae]QTM05650.1 hypothetical protein GQX61_05355 [Brachyspira hyodysenteriae]
MENEDLTKTEIIDLVIEYNNNDTKQMLYFIENDCNIKFEVKNIDQVVCSGHTIKYIYKILYNNKYSKNEYFYFNNDVYIIIKLKRY